MQKQRFGLEAYTPSSVLASVTPQDKVITDHTLGSGGVCQ